jgi:hypothetical protein
VFRDLASPSAVGPVLQHGQLEILLELLLHGDLCTMDSAASP